MDKFLSLFNPSEIDSYVSNRKVLKANPLAQLAVDKLQLLLEEGILNHNFGLNPLEEGPVIGKMFGVLVVADKFGEIGYLSAFSGKLAGSNQHDKFVPPIFDMLTEKSFLNIGMSELNEINAQIKTLKNSTENNNDIIQELSISRRNISRLLQQKLFDQYHVLNRRGDLKSLNCIFTDAGYKNPPSGAGECAAPKLYQYAFRNEFTPIAIKEFWWGLSPKSETWKHQEYYPSCKEKCEPILRFMLGE